MKNPEDFVLPLLRKAFVKSVENYETEVKKRTPTVTGRLKNSIHVESINTEGDEWEGEIGTDIEYAGFIEYGVRRWSKKYPVLVFRHDGPVAMFRRGKLAATQKMRKKIQRALKKGIKQYLKS